MFNPFKNPFENPIKQKHVKQGNIWVQRIKTITGYVANASALAMESFWRRGFGEQHLNNMAVGSSIVLFWGAFALLWMPDVRIEPAYNSDRFFMFIVATLITIRFVMNFADIETDKKSGFQRHTGDNGIPLTTRFFKVDELRAKQWLEPILTLLLSSILSLLGAEVVGFLLFLGACAMWWREHQLQNKLRQTYTTMLNSRIDAQRMKQMSKVGIQGYYQNTNQQRLVTGKVKHPNPKPHDAIRSK